MVDKWGTDLWSIPLRQGTIDLKKKIFSSGIDEKPHIGDIPANEVPISLVEERPDVLHAFYHVSRVS
jgi:hypothetical protein